MFGQLEGVATTSGAGSVESIAPSKARVIQDLASLAQQDVRGERLLKERKACVAHAMTDRRIIRVARSEKQFHLGSLERELLGQLSTAEARHHDIGEQEMDLGRELLGDEERFTAIGGLQTW